MFAYEINKIIRTRHNVVRGHPFRTSGLPGRGGFLESRTSIVIFEGIQLFNLESRGTSDVLNGWLLKNRKMYHSVSLILI